MGCDDGSGRKPKAVGDAGELADSHHCGATSAGHVRKDDQIGAGRDNRYVIYTNDQVYPEYLVSFR